MWSMAPDRSHVFAVPREDRHLEAEKVADIDLLVGHVDVRRRVEIARRIGFGVRERVDQAVARLVVDMDLPVVEIGDPDPVAFDEDVGRPCGLMMAEAGDVLAGGVEHRHLAATGIGNVQVARPLIDGAVDRLSQRAGAARPEVIEGACLEVDHLHR
jgi:hypothetical protein